MTLPRTVADVLADHVVFEVESIDRMYLNVYVPQLQRELGLIGYLRRRLGCSVNSTAPLAAVTEAFNDAVRRFAAEQQVPLIDFVKGQRKDDVMHEHLARFTGTEGVLFVGRAQEKARVFRTERRRNTDGKAYPWIVSRTAVINHWYFYCVDADFGPFFYKYVSYFPYNAKLCINGNEWAKRQAARRGSGSPRWTTGSPRAVTYPRCRPCATVSARNTSRPSRTSGRRSYRARSRTRTGPRATATTSRSCRRSSV